MKRKIQMIFDIWKSGEVKSKIFCRTDFKHNSVDPCSQIQNSTTEVMLLHWPFI